MKNVLIILSDEQRWDTLGCAGVYPSIRTPALDGLAANGARFDRCYTPYPLCCPARVSLWTGLMPHNHHVAGNWLAIRPDLADRGLPRFFRDAGYHTIYAGKWHVPGTTPQRFHYDDAVAIPAIRDGRDRGRLIIPYRAYAESRGYRLAPGNSENLTVGELQACKGRAFPMGSSEIAYEDCLEMWVTRQLFETLDRRPADKPFFAVVSYSAPHFPMVVPAPFDAAYAPGDELLPPNFMQGIEGKAREATSGPPYFRGDAPVEQWRRQIALYHGFCAMIDDLVARVLKRLADIGQLDNTVVVFTSDHGDMMGSHGMNMKGFPIQYEEICRVPLIVRDPDCASGSARGAVCERFVTLTDIMPTLAELCGVPMEKAETSDAISFAPLVAAPNAAPIRDCALSEFFKLRGKEGGAGEHVDPGEFGQDAHDAVNFSLRVAGGRYLFRTNDIEEYYDHAADPHENVNVAARPEYAARVAACRRALLDQLQSAPPRLKSAVARMTSPLGDSER